MVYNLGIVITWCTACAVSSLLPKITSFLVLCILPIQYFPTHQMLTLMQLLPIRQQDSYKQFGAFLCLEVFIFTTLRTRFHGRKVLYAYALMAGCDYIHAPGWGPATAVKYIQEHPDNYFDMAIMEAALGEDPVKALECFVHHVTPLCVLCVCVGT